MTFRLPVLAAAFLALSACSPELDTDTSPRATDTQAIAPISAEPALAFERYQLPNGLDVIFHIDRSDPVVAVVLTAHVGSAREEPGLTGFAHLFEHLLFLESENLGKGGLDAMSARIGGSGANGSTSRDRTNYLQTVPNDALEKMLWAEADKLGWFINTVTDEVLAKEKQVVKNEKRQSNDNRPYGHTRSVISSALYPAGHPYSWEVIGSLDDIQRASLDDVKTFFRRWYTPNNVTLSIAGDFDTAQARAWVERYFAEIPSGPALQAQIPGIVELAADKSLFHEDNYAQLPELTLVWPSVPRYHPDYYPLTVLAGLLAEGKKAPLNAVLIDELQLTNAVQLGGYEGELAGELILRVRAFNAVSLDLVRAGIDQAFVRFEQQGIAARDLERIKTLEEIGYYNSVATVLGKAVELGELAAVHGRPELLNEQLAALRAVSADEVLRVYNTYVKQKPHVATSFVPRGQVELALAGAERATVFEEPIVAGAEDAVDPNVQASYERTPSSFDRSVEPGYGQRPQLNPPAVWRDTLTNGLRVSGIADRELPLVQFELAFEGGTLLENPQAPGAASFVAALFDKGTTTLTVAELEEQLALLGASVRAQASHEQFIIQGRTLARNFNATMALIADMLLQPRWDAAEFELARASLAADLQDALASPLAMADRAYATVTWGSEHVFARDPRGTQSSVASMTLNDLQAWHARALAPGLASLRLVGAVDSNVLPDLNNVFSNWNLEAPTLPTVAMAQTPVSSRVYLYDMPGAAQSVFRFGHPGPLRTDPAFDAVQVLNYRLGGGGFASRLTQELREGKGYTYGINSQFNATGRQGGFLVASSVRSNVTLEAAELIGELISNYGSTYTGDDLEVSRSFLLKSQARAFESLGAKLSMLAEIADYGLADDYVLQKGALAEGMTVENVRALAERYLKPEAMHYVVVGDASTQLQRLEELGLGEVILLNGEIERPPRDL